MAGALLRPRMSVLNLAITPTSATVGAEDSDFIVLPDDGMLRIIVGAVIARFAGGTGIPGINVKGGGVIDDMTNDRANVTHLSAPVGASERDGWRWPKWAHRPCLPGSRVDVSWRTLVSAGSDTTEKEINLIVREIPLASREAEEAIARAKALKPKLYRISAGASVTTASVQNDSEKRIIRMICGGAGDDTFDSSRVDIKMADKRETILNGDDQVADGAAADDGVAGNAAGIFFAPFIYSSELDIPIPWGASEQAQLRFPTAVSNLEFTLWTTLPEPGTFPGDEKEEIPPGPPPVDLRPPSRRR